MERPGALSAPGLFVWCSPYRLIRWIKQPDHEQNNPGGYVYFHFHLAGFKWFCFYLRLKIIFVKLKKKESLT